MQLNSVICRKSVIRVSRLPANYVRGFHLFRKGRRCDRSGEDKLLKYNMQYPFGHPIFRQFDFPTFSRSNFFENWPETFTSLPSMSTDVVEKDTEYLVSCDLPGVNKKDIKLTLKGNVLEISGERKGQKEEQSADQTIHRKERYHGNFVRQLNLPDEVAKDISHITAKFEDGVLYVNIPKKRPTSKEHVTINVE